MSGRIVEASGKVHRKQARTVTIPGAPWIGHERHGQMSEGANRQRRSLSCQRSRGSLEPGDRLAVEAAEFSATREPDGRRRQGVVKPFPERDLGRRVETSACRAGLPAPEQGFAELEQSEAASRVIPLALRVERRKCTAKEIGRLVIGEGPRSISPSRERIANPCSRSWIPGKEMMGKLGDALGRPVGTPCEPLADERVKRSPPARHEVAVEHLGEQRMREPDATIRALGHHAISDRLVDRPRGSQVSEADEAGQERRRCFASHNGQRLRDPQGRWIQWRQGIADDSREIVRDRRTAVILQRVFRLQLADHLAQEERIAVGHRPQPISDMRIDGLAAADSPQILDHVHHGEGGERQNPRLTAQGDERLVVPAGIARPLACRCE